MNTIRDLFIPLSQLGVIKISGEKVETFLQGQLTCDAKAVTENQSQLGAHCDAKGRIQATLRLLKYKNNYYLLLPLNTVTHLLQCFGKYAVFSRVQLTDISQHWGKISLSGSSVISLLEPIFKTVPTTFNQISIQDHWIVLNLTKGCTQRFLLLNTENDFTELKAYLNKNTNVGNNNDWQLLDIMDGIPSIDHKTIGLFTPHQINYQLIGGINFNKGCYIGQEIIARTHYLGKLKQSMYRISFTSDNDIEPGAAMYIEDQLQSRVIGKLIMSALIDKNQYQALACLDVAAISSNIRIRDLRGPIVTVLNPST